MTVPALSDCLTASCYDLVLTGSGPVRIAAETSSVSRDTLASNLTGNPGAAIRPLPSILPHPCGARLPTFSIMLSSDSEGFSKK
jgi:hypothetical protein